MSAIGLLDASVGKTHAGFRTRLAAPVSIALLGLILNTIVAARMAPTSDEQFHLSYGVRLLQGRSDRLSEEDDSKMPVSVLNVIPRALVKGWRAGGLPGNPKVLEKLREIRASRYATVLATLLLCWLVFLLANSLFGRTAGLAAELLFVLSPDVMAHGTLSTTDLYGALGTVAFLYCFRRFLLAPTLPLAAQAAAVLAFAQLTKFSAVYLYPAVAIVVVSLWLYRRLAWRQIAPFLIFHLIFFLGCINAGFLFRQSFTPLSEYRFQSAAFQALQRVPFVRRLPVPLPMPYLYGFDWMSYRNATGHNLPNIVLLGEARGPTLGRFHGFPSYYLVCYVLKEPVGMQLLLLVSGWWLIRRRRPGEFLTGEFPLLITALVTIAMLSFFSNTQIGIRHILPGLVLFVILSGAAFSGWEQFSRRRKLLLAGCVVYIAVSVGSYYPHMIPYFNELAGDRKLAYQYLADSNLDWGQANWLAMDFVKRNPGVQINPLAPVHGPVLVSANLMAGVIPADADYWLRRLALKPVAHVGYAYLLFLVP